MTELGDFVKRLRQLVEEDELQQACDELRAWAACHPAWQHDISLLVMRHNSLRRANRRGVLTPDQVLTRQVQLGSAMLELLRELEAEEQDEAVSSTTPSPATEEDQTPSSTGQARPEGPAPAQPPTVEEASTPLGPPTFDATHWHLPDDAMWGFVEISAGPFLMGSDPQQDAQAYENEQPQHTIFLDTYFMARYPVTVDQFRDFVQVTGYKVDNEDSLKGTATHPVRHVTWHEARAYAEWLTARLRDSPLTPRPLARLLREERWVVRLPTEAEWEKAARGPDGRIYPWGNDPDPERANYRDTGIGGTSPVGAFPDGASPYGCLDMAGNVWEWTASLWGEDLFEPEFTYPYDPSDGREDQGADDGVARVLRGGAFYANRWRVRCAARSYSPNRRSYNLGFRLVVAPGL
jgi:formylglycine-generating enzyme required for sulfatase activity